MAKTPQQAAQKWDASTSLGSQAWLTGLQQTTKPIVSAAINARGVMQANFNAATAPGGLWEQRLSQVGDAGIKSAAADKLLSYPWPGNVRELQNCIERAVALSQFDHIGIDDLPERVRDFKTSRVTVESSDPSELLAMEEVERRYILRVLEAVGGNKTLAAQVLGFDRRTLYRKLDRCKEATPAKRDNQPAHP